MIKTLITIPNIVFFLGGPGTGKGTICQYISKKYNLYHMSVGQLLRQVNTTDKDFDIINNHMNKGSIVPSTISCRLILQALTDLSDYKIVLIDGFPRNFENFNCWHQLLSKETNLLKIYYLICDESTMINRCLSRHKCGTNGSRNDDELDIIHMRIAQYRKELVPLIDYFRPRYEIVSIDAGREIDKVRGEICADIAATMHSLG